MLFWGKKDKTTTDESNDTTMNLEGINFDDDQDVDTVEIDSELLTEDDNDTTVKIEEPNEDELTEEELAQIKADEEAEKQRALEAEMEAKQLNEKNDLSVESANEFKNNIEVSGDVELSEDGTMSLKLEEDDDIYAEETSNELEISNIQKINKTVEPKEEFVPFEEDGMDIVDPNATSNDPVEEEMESTLIDDINKPSKEDESEITSELDPSQLFGEHNEVQEDEMAEENQIVEEVQEDEISEEVQEDQIVEEVQEDEIAKEVQEDEKAIEVQEDVENVFDSKNYDSYSSQLKEILSKYGL